VPLVSIRTDNAYMCEPLTSYCHEQKIKLTASAPHTQQQNGKSESSVKQTKRVAR
jgi:hypothetical protein